MKPWRRRGLFVCLLITFFLTACDPVMRADVVVTAEHTSIADDAVISTPTPLQYTASTTPNPTSEPSSPRYVFLFIGDGMGFAQVKAAEHSGSGLLFAEFSARGIITTRSADAAVTDSAAAATAIACGVKTNNGVLGLAADEKTPLESITYKLHKAGRKVGIVTNVSLNHATPAAFYAHSDGRSNYYGIALQMADSGFDYFGGGALLAYEGKDGNPDAYAVLAENGYALADTREAILALDGASGKTYARSPGTLADGSLPYAPDESGQSVALEEFVQVVIHVLDNAKGFFLMCESGKIDWACHNNNAEASTGEMLALDRAVRVALDFGQQNPDETLIVVTADHETGGMTVDDSGAVHYSCTAHTAADVPVYAWGAGAEEFVGQYDNTDIFWKLMRLNGLK